MHDRRIDGETFTFGNAGGLFMNAMTWYDHKTESIWSQPWGRAIQGELKGVELFLLPSQVTTWANWKSQHPDTMAMTNDVSRALFRQGFDPDFVLGLLLVDEAKAYYYRDIASVGLVNDKLGDTPIVVWAADENFTAFVRQVGDQLLTFRPEDGRVVDDQTNSTWDMARGLATDGPLRGEGLQPVPGSTAYDWAWLDFYPDSAFYQP